MVRAAVALTAFVAVAHAELRPETDLTHSCFNFPTSSFNRANCVKASYGSSPHTAGGLSVGEAAYDFTLNDMDGESVSLSGILALGKPVVMVWGMWTCPAYQGLGTTAPFDQCSYKVRKDSYSLAPLVLTASVASILIAPSI
jgi:hypothetical protein